MGTTCSSVEECAALPTYRDVTGKIDLDCKPTKDGVWPLQVVPADVTAQAIVRRVVPPGYADPRSEEVVHLRMVRNVCRRR